MGDQRRVISKQRCSMRPIAYLRVVDPVVGVEHAAGLAPRQRLRGRHAVDDLEDAAVVHAVLRPRAGEVLDAADLDRRHAAVHRAHPVPMGVTGGVGDDGRAPRDHGGQAVARVGVDAEVLRVPLALGPLLVMAHREHRHGRRRRSRVEPVELLRRQVPGRGVRDRGVEERDCHTGELEPLVAGVVALAAEGVVVAPHDVQARPEGGAVARLEGGELLVPPVVGEVALDDDRVEVGRRHLVHRGPVHRLRIGVAVRVGAQDRPEVAAVDPAGLDLAEVDVVDRAQPAAQRAGRPGQGAELDAEVFVVVVGLEILDPLDRRPVMERRRVLGHGGQLDGHRAQTHGRGRRSGIGWLHQRPLNRQTDGRRFRSPRRRPDAATMPRSPR